MSGITRRSFMRVADRAYYGAYTPACPIQPDSLRNRVHGVATWTSRLDKDGCFSYESGLGRWKASAIEFAHYLEVLAMEMQPVLDTLVRATVADNEPAPKAWQFQFEMAKHARSLREARSHSDLSFAHVAASWQCARAVHFYRKYRKQAEDLLRATPQPEPTQQTTGPPASTAPSAGQHPSRVTPECSPSVLNPSTRASAPSLPLPGPPAEDEEGGHGLPAHAPPQKDVVCSPKEGSGSTDNAARLAVKPQHPSSSSALARRVNEATQQGSRAQRTPSEAASPSNGVQLPIPVPTRSSGRLDCPPHLALRPLLFPAPAPCNQPVALTRTHPAPSKNSNELLTAENGFIAGARFRQCRPPSSGSTPALKRVESAQEHRLAAPIPCVKAGRRPKSTNLGASRMGGARAGKSRRPRLSTSTQAMFARCVPQRYNVPSPPQTSPTASRDMLAARTDMRPALWENVNEQASTKDVVSTREESDTRQKPRHELLAAPWAAHSPRRCLTARGPALAPGLVDNVQAQRESDVSAREEGRTRHAPWPKTLLAAYSPRRCPSPHNPASAVKFIEIGPARLANSNELASKEFGVSAREERCTRRAPQDESRVEKLPRRDVDSSPRKDVELQGVGIRLQLPRDANENKGGWVHQNAPSPPRAPSSPSPFPESPDLTVARARTHPTPSASSSELTSAELDISSQRESSTRSAPWSKMLVTAQPQRQLSALLAPGP
ncbi:uncharacterized protein SCHCODRAFT_02557675, partial [Schizophyllum commune H4-8]|uniref:uncharacterized protein n=1 Tax=Schizophyllum commune (strain H4-8 / FGSC 9210) TaxID=578458 RepID=UPI00215DD9CB